MNTVEFATEVAAPPREAIAAGAGARTMSVPLRVFGRDDALQIIPLDVRETADDLYVISRDSRRIGYIQRVGHVFVALVGERLDHAEECGQSLLWDKAATSLVEEADARSRRAMPAPEPPARAPFPEVQYLVGGRLVR
ncbi:hypothetical protein SAMN04489806_1951 [Paramicrobacterium humi]|uniref:Uncharacterized protein n=1 Tax=Paramicrobacterium humi TaxID=640635 RepID=A0A1H4MRD5_9MICO|nr:hypothetical protein [Microbacterium humi]SEB85344.1 hypothetical protein SAMN04489806_1951 [Microbacterium humi]